MSTDIIHALVSIQNWGDDNELMNILRENPHTISIFHIMGRYSYLIDANFDTKEQLSAWISLIKSLKMNTGIPVVISLQTQRIIDVHKQKEAFSLSDYANITKKFHFFVKIDNPHHDEGLVDLLKKSGIVYSVLHVQGENTFTIEVIADVYDQYRQLLFEMKKFGSINHIETQEVISVVKYRNSVIDDKGNLEKLMKDSREIYTL